MTEYEYESIIRPSRESHSSTENSVTFPSSIPSTITPSTAIPADVDSVHTLTDYTGPNSFFANLPAQHTSVARLKGEYGKLRFVIRRSDHSCLEARSHLHKTSLQKLEDKINHPDIFDYASADKGMRSSAMESNAEDPEIGYRILGTGEGKTKATVQIGDSKSDLRLSAMWLIDRCTGNVPTMWTSQK